MSKTIYIKKEEELVMESVGEVKKYLQDNISYTNSGFQYWLDDRYCASELLEDIEDYCKSADDFVDEYIEECWEDLLEDFDIEEVELEEEVILINEVYNNYITSDYIRPIATIDLLDKLDCITKRNCITYLFHTSSLVLEEVIMITKEMNVFQITLNEEHKLVIYSYIND